jgi:uncharacterized protein (TIGR01777 family)
MRVLVTGATGFVGRAVTARLLARGHEVLALSRDPRSARARLPQEVEILPYGRLPAGIEAVIHLAGASIAGGLWTASRKKKLWTSRVEGTRHLVAELAAAAERWGSFPAVFVSASGMGYHGDAGARAVRPEDPPGNDFLARMAAAWENEAQAARAFGARVACIRLGMVLGREGGALPPQALAFRLGLGAVLGTGGQYWPWIRVGAAADLFVEAVRNPGFTGPVHAAAGAPLTQREFARELGKTLRRPVLFRIPQRLLRLVLGEMADLFLHGQKVVPEAESALASDSLSAAMRDLFK